MKTSFTITNTPLILTAIAAGTLALSALAQQSESRTGTTPGTTATTSSATDRANAEALFRRLDSNGDGTISREEFKRNAHQVPIGPQPGTNVISPGPTTPATAPETPRRSTDADPRDDVPGNPPTGSGTRGATGNSPK